MGSVVRVQWQSWNGDSIENLVLKENSEGIFAESTIISKGKEPFIAAYTIVCDLSWHTRKFNMELEFAEKKKTISLTSNGSGKWSSHSGIVTKLDGAIDIDVTATPFTNTLPIRRLKLKENQSQIILAVYITVPELDISIQPQRYTCLFPNKRYRFEQIDNHFVREIEVDEHALVLTYPGLFRRI